MAGVMERKSLGDELNTNKVSQDFASLRVFVGHGGFVTGVNCDDLW